jgi:hypothetical protein
MTNDHHKTTRNYGSRSIRGRRPTLRRARRSIEHMKRELQDN